VTHLSRLVALLSFGAQASGYPLRCAGVGPSGLPAAWSLIGVLAEANSGKIGYPSSSPAIYGDRSDRGRRPAREGDRVGNSRFTRI